MASTMRFDRWESPTGNEVATVNNAGNIGINILPTNSYPLEISPRFKIRSNGSDQSAGIWFTGTDGVETSFLGSVGNTSSVPLGIFHNGAWRFYVASNGLATFSNDIELIKWRTNFDRAWDNYPSITVYNTTDQGPQSEFRIHGYPGANGGDYSVVTRCDGGYVTGSDERRKTNVETISNALEKVNLLSGKTFNVVNSDLSIQEDLSSEQTGKKFGLIAQEAISIIPEAIKYYEEADEINENGYANAYSIDYASLVPLLIEAIKELSAKVSEIENKLGNIT